MHGLLTLDAYLMGRNKTYPEDYTLEIQCSAQDLIKRVNNLLIALRIDSVTVSSGWRPLMVNQRAGGAKRSLHMIGKAVDLADPHQELSRCIREHSSLLLDYGLWLEDPAATPVWCHLDTGIRDSRLVRVFKP